MINYVNNYNNWTAYVNTFEPIIDKKNEIQYSKKKKYKISIKKQDIFYKIRYFMGKSYFFSWRKGMNSSGTFYEYESAESKIYERQAKLDERLQKVRYEKNDEWQEVRLLQNKQKDDKFKLFMWLGAGVVLLLLRFSSYFISAPPTWVNPVVGYLVGIVATFWVLLGRYVFLPLAILCIIVTIVRAVLYYLKNTNSERAVRLAELSGVENRCVLEAEHLKKIKSLSAYEGTLVMEKDSLEEEYVKYVLDSVDEGSYSPQLAVSELELPSEDALWELMQKKGYKGYQK